MGRLAITDRGIKKSRRTYSGGYEETRRRPAFLAHLSRSFRGKPYRIGLEPASVLVCVSTLSNMYISETSGPIAIKF